MNDISKNQFIDFTKALSPDEVSQIVTPHEYVIVFEEDDSYSQTSKNVPPMPLTWSLYGFMTFGLLLLKNSFNPIEKEYLGYNTNKENYVSQKPLRSTNGAIAIYQTTLEHGDKDIISDIDQLGPRYTFLKLWGSIASEETFKYCVSEFIDYITKNNKECKESGKFFSTNESSLLKATSKGNINAIRTVGSIPYISSYINITEENFRAHITLADWKFLQHFLPDIDSPTLNPTIKILDKTSFCKTQFKDYAFN